MPLYAPPEPPAPHVITNPSFVSRPTYEQMSAVLPPKATRQGVDGGATMRCRVAVNGTLQGCEIIAEAPTGLGFGAATLLLAPYFLMKPKLIDGKPVEGGRIVFPVRYHFPDGAVEGGQDVKVLSWTPWTATPTAAEVKAAYPAGALRNHVEGEAVFRCELSLAGKPRACDLMREAPLGQGFGAAGRKLLPHFRARLGDVQPAKLREMRITVATRFAQHAADPDAPFALPQPDWAVPPDPGLADRAYPAAARAAHVTTGRAVLACHVAEDGSLAGCAAQSESPEGLGFGAAAAQVAAAMRVNGWTRDGERAAGARIFVPVRLNDMAAAPQVTHPD